MHALPPAETAAWLASICGEVGINVIGVLIALGAEQLVEFVHERQVAAQARENVRAEAALESVSNLPLRTAEHASGSARR